MMLICAYNEHLSIFLQNKYVRTSLSVRRHESITASDIAAILSFFTLFSFYIFTFATGPYIAIMYVHYSPPNTLSALI